jgi:hypothetical protein
MVGRPASISAGSRLSDLEVLGAWAPQSRRNSNRRVSLVLGSNLHFVYRTYEATRARPVGEFRNFAQAAPTLDAIEDASTEAFMKASSVTYLAGTTKAEERFSLLSVRQSLLKEFEQSRPVALGRALIKDPAHPEPQSRVVRRNRSRQARHHPGVSTLTSGSSLQRVGRASAAGDIARRKIAAMEVRHETL